MVARNTARFPLGAGMDQKSDEKHIEPPKLEVLQNAELRETGKIKKRRSLKQASDGGAGDVATLVGGKRRILVDADSTHGTTLTPNGSAHAIPTGLHPVTDSRTLLSDSAYSQGHCAAYDGSLYVAAKPGDGALVIYEVDPGTGETLSDPANGTISNAVDAETFRIVSVADHGVLVIWADDPGGGFYEGDVHAQLFVSGQFQGSPTTLVSADLELDPNPSGSAEEGVFDVVVDSGGDNLWLAYRTISATTKVLGWSITGTGASITLTPYASSITYAYDTDAGIGVDHDPDNDRVLCVLATTAGGGGVNALSCAGDLTSSVAAVLASSTGAPTRRNAAITYLGSNSAVCLFHKISSGTTEAVVQQDIDTDMLAKGSNTHTMHGVVLAHKPVACSPHGNPHILFGILRHTDDLEPFYVTMMSTPTDASSEPRPVASYQYTTAIAVGDYPEFGVASVAQDDTSTGERFFWAGAIRTNVRAEAGGDIVSTLAMGLHTIDFSAEKTCVHAAAHAALMTAGGIPSAIVGNEATVAGHLASPVILSSSIISTGQWAINTTHNVVAVYEFYDQQGRVWQSRPSAVETIEQDGASNGAQVVVQMPVAPPDDVVAIGVAVYATIDPGTGVKYRASEYRAPASEGTFLDGLSVTLTPSAYSDAELATNEVLYTDAGLLEHYPPPPLTSIVKHKNRFAGIHAETGDVWLTGEFSGGEGVFWNPVLSVKNDDPLDKPTALVSTDAALLVMYRNRAGYIYGDGPNNQGVGQPFSTIQFLPDADVGAVSQKSVTKIPAGVFFCDADKGFHLLPYGGGAPTYIGRDVDGAPSETIIGTAHLPDRHEVRVGFYNEETVSGNPAGGLSSVTAAWYTFHYDAGQWSSGYAADHTSGNLYAIADGNEFLFDGVGEDSAAGYDGASTYVPLLVKTGWILMSEASRKQGLFRLWNIYAFIESIDDHDLNLKVYFDYDETAGPDTLSQATWQGDRLKVWPGKQLIEAFKLEIYDAEDSGNTSTAEGYELSDIEIHFGVYQGVKPRVPPAAITAGS